MSTINTAMHKTLKYAGLRCESYKIINMSLAITLTRKQNRHVYHGLGTDNYFTAHSKSLLHN